MLRGNVNVADDVVLLALRNKGLQHMITAMENYGNMWRFNFNIKKTAVVVFGEPKRKYNMLKNERQWLLYGQKIPQKGNIEHVGVILSANLSGRPLRSTWIKLRYFFCIG